MNDPLYNRRYAHFSIAKGRLIGLNNQTSIRNYRQKDSLDWNTLPLKLPYKKGYTNSRLFYSYYYI